MKYGEAAPVPGQVGLTRCRGYRIGLYIKFPGNKYIPTYLCTVWRRCGERERERKKCIPACVLTYMRTIHYIRFRYVPLCSPIPCHTIPYIQKGLYPPIWGSSIPTGLLILIVARAIEVSVSSDTQSQRGVLAGLRITIHFFGYKHPQLVIRSQLFFSCWSELTSSRVWSQYHNKSAEFFIVSDSFAVQSMGIHWLGDAPRWECAVMENVVRPADNLRQQSQDPQGGSLAAGRYAMGLFSFSRSDAKKEHH